MKSLYTLFLFLLAQAALAVNTISPSEIVGVWEQKQSSSKGEYHLVLEIHPNKSAEYFSVNPQRNYHIKANSEGFT